MGISLDGSSTARRGCAKSSCTAVVAATRTTSRRDKSATKLAGVHHNAIATASLVSNTMNMVVNSAVA